MTIQNSYLYALIFTGALEVCGTSDQGASLHNPVSPVKINCDLHTNFYFHLQPLNIVF
jgi:hypothetical protein